MCGEGMKVEGEWMTRQVVRMNDVGVEGSCIKRKQARGEGRNVVLGE